jgi:ribosomal protein S6-L-glutamate ligase RimK-like protein
MPSKQPIGIYYEHPHWFKPLFAELERRGTPFAKINASQHHFDPAQLNGEGNYSLVFNRMSPSAYRRGHGQGIFYTLYYLAHLEQRGKRVVNGQKAFRYETSKALQLSLLQSLGLPYPKTRVINSPADALEASEGLRFPIVVKPNIGGSGAGVKKFDSRKQLEESVHADPASPAALDLGLDTTALVQEFIPARGGHIVRVEVVGGQFIYGIKVHLTGETFDLCPADICRTTGGQELSRAACPIDAPKSGLKVEGYTPADKTILGVERIMRAANIEVGGIEYIIDDRDGQLYYYDINALSNFVADGPRVVGFDPFIRLVDFLEVEARAKEAA